MSEQMTPEQSGGEDDGTPEYRLSHLQEDIAEPFSERDAIELVAPLNSGGVGSRVNNRAVFTVFDSERTRWVEQVLDYEGFAWTVTGEPGQYAVLGRVIRDARELRPGDRIHLNKRGGPFKVYRVLEQENGPEVLQKSAPAITVELSNVDTGTDWMMVHWKDSGGTWAYVRTKDKRASGGFRYRKVERVERGGRIGPFRMFAPSGERVSEGFQDEIQDRVQSAQDNGWLDTHPTDVDRVLELMSRPACDVFTPEDASTIKSVVMDAAEAFKRQGNAMAMEAGDDEEMKALAADNQMWGRDLKSLAKAFNLADMDAVDDTEDTPLYVHKACGAGFVNRHKYPTHCRECDADEQIGNTEVDK